MTDRELQQHVQQALDWEPSVDAAEIGVSVDDGVVTLRGDVRTYSAKEAAERVALRVYGVKAVANDIHVHLTEASARTDTDIAQAALAALKWNTRVPNEKISLAVANGWITLKGEVEWEYQRLAAADTVRDLVGVLGITNSIIIVPHVSVSDVKSKIEAALKRSAEIDARRINVTTVDGKVILSGQVRSWLERTEAWRAAWAAPGVRHVDDRMTIVP